MFSDHEEEDPSQPTADVAKWYYTFIFVMVGILMGAVSKDLADKKATINTSFEQCKECYEVAIEFPDSEIYFADCSCYIPDKMNIACIEHVGITNGMVYQNNAIQEFKIKCDNPDYNENALLKDVTQKYVDCPLPEGVTYVDELDNLDTHGGIVGENTGVSVITYRAVWIVIMILGSILLCRLLLHCYVKQQKNPRDHMIWYTFLALSFNCCCFLLMVEMATTQPEEFGDTTCSITVVPEELNEITFIIAAIMIGWILIFSILLWFQEYCCFIETELDDLDNLKMKVFYSVVAVLGVAQSIVYLRITQFIDITFGLILLGGTGFALFISFCYLVTPYLPKVKCFQSEHKTRIELGQSCTAHSPSGYE